MPEQRIATSTFDDSQLTSSTREILLQDINFVAEKVPDKSYTQLKEKYVPLNSGKFSSNDQQSTPSDNQDNQSSHHHDGIPLPKVIIYPENAIKLTWNKVMPIGAGLVNLGNTCYLNSVLQCLSYTPPLANYALAEEHKAECRKVGFCVLCELQSHVRRCLRSNGSSIKPWSIVNKLRSIASHIQFGRQEDAHEFLRYVVDGIQTGYLAAYPKNLDQYSKDTTMIYRIFGGYLRSLVQCSQCKYKSIKYDPMLDLSLDIADVNTLSGMLRKFTEPEILSGRDMYTCSKCKVKVKAIKKFTIHRAPAVLTIPIKRFNKMSLFGGKNSKKIKFSETLDLRPYMTSRTGPPLPYSLYGVLVHSGGSCNSGHYYCYVKASNNHWYCMNDSHVSKSSINTVLLQEAYILFYISSPTLSKSQCEEKNSSSSLTRSDHDQAFPSSPAKSLKKFTDRGNSFSRSTFVSISPKESTPKIPIILKHDSTTTSEVKSVDNSDNKDKFNQLEKYQMSESDNKVNVMKTLHDNLHSKNDKVTNLESLPVRKETSTAHLKAKQGFVPRQVLSLKPKPYGPQIITSDTKRSNVLEKAELNQDLLESRKNNSLEKEESKVVSSNKDIKEYEPTCNNCEKETKNAMSDHKTKTLDCPRVDLSTVTFKSPRNDDYQTKKGLKEENLNGKKKKKEKKKKHKRKHFSDSDDEEKARKKHKKHHKKHSKEHRKMKEKSLSKRKLIDKCNDSTNYSSVPSMIESRNKVDDRSIPRKPNTAPIKAWDDNKVNRSHWDGSRSQYGDNNISSRSRDAYSISVKSWEGNESSLETHKTGDLKRKRHYLDEEIDRGKIKKTKHHKNKIATFLKGKSLFQKYQDRRNSNRNHDRYRDLRDYRSKGFRRM